MTGLCERCKHEEELTQMWDGEMLCICCENGR